MNALSLSRAAELIQGRWLGEDVHFSSVSTDTRSLHQGDLFVALKGPRFDGHDHLMEAQGKGAVAAMLSREMSTELPRLLVEDTKLGLGDLARAWRGSFGGPLTAVTGSNGKTTVKEMLAAILRQQGRVLATIGNLNNEIGMPLTLLRLQDEDFAVIEMGANHPGEIGYLSRIAQPDVAVICNAGAAHLEGFGDLAGVAHAKGEIVTGLSANGTLILNADDPWYGYWRGLAGERRILSFGTVQPADVRSDPAQVQTRWTDDGFRCLFPVSLFEDDFAVELRLAGRHNLANALAAATAAAALGIGTNAIAAGLASVSPVPGRLQTRHGRSGLRLIDDTYNANPDSVAAAIELLATAPGEQWLVLGDLAELGAGGKRLHRQVGEVARKAGIHRLFTVGELSWEASEGFGAGAWHFADQAALLRELENSLPAEAWVLVKGSRSSAMENIVAALGDREED